MRGAASEAGCDECEAESEEHVVTCEMQSFASALDALTAKFGEPASAKFVWRTDIAIPIEGEAAEQLMKLLTTLDDHDDVQSVFSNEDISDAEMERLSA